MTSIGERTFTDCTGLTSIDLPSSVTSIGKEAFYRCTSLKSIDIPDGVTSIGDSAFQNCDKLASVTIPSSVTSIGEYAFYKCLPLASVTIPSSVTSIGKWAFYGCKNLKNVYALPTTPPDLGVEVFKDCSTGLKIFVSGDKVSDYKAAWSAYENYIESRSYAYDESTNTLNIYTNDGTTAWRNDPDLKGKIGTIARVNVAGGVTSLGKDALKDCKALESVALPSTLTEIKEYAFSGCSKLASISIPNGVASIGEYAFASCAALESVTMPGGVDTIAKSTFMGCTMLASIDLPDSVTSIGESAFSGCAALASVAMPGVISIGHSAFGGCTTLASVTIPGSVTAIDTGAFYGCSKLSNVYALPTNPPSLGDIAFDGLPGSFKIFVSQASLDSYKTNWAKYKDHIESRSYAYDDSTNTLNIYTNDGTTAWRSDPELSKKIEDIEHVNFAGDVTSIGKDAFNGCKALPSITIPSSVTSIGESAFSGCAKLTSVTMPGVTTIGLSAFSGCEKLVSITMPDVTSIGEKAFKDCKALESVALPSTLTEIKDGAFYGCSKLASIDIPEGVTSIGVQAFASCAVLESVTMPDSLTSIGQDAFISCAALESVTIPSNVTLIGDGAFYGCSQLNNVYALPTNPPSLAGDIVFENLPKDFKIFVKPASLDDYKAVWSAYESHIYVDPKEALEAMKPVAEAQLAGFKATNDTTAAQVLDAVNAVMQYGVVAAWKGEPVITKATKDAAGSIVGIMLLSVNGQSIEVSVNLPIAKLNPAEPKDEPKKLASAGDPKKLASTGDPLGAAAAGMGGLALAAGAAVAFAVRRKLSGK